MDGATAIKAGDMTEEQLKELCEQFGIKELSLDALDKKMQDEYARGIKEGLSALGESLRELLGVVEGEHEGEDARTRIRTARGIVTTMDEHGLTRGHAGH
jgi:hypothetical protein